MGGRLMNNLGFYLMADSVHAVLQTALLLDRVKWGDDLCGVSDCVEDVFDGIALPALIAGNSINIQEVATSFDRLLPHYLELVRNSYSVDDCEMYMDEPELRAYLGLPAEAKIATFPKLLISDGGLGYAYMQAAALKAGVDDAYTRVWYDIVRFLLWTGDEDAIYATQQPVVLN